VPTTIAKINQVKALMGQADLVRVSFGGANQASRLRVVAHGGNPELRAVLEGTAPGAVPEFPAPLGQREFEVEFGTGYQHVLVTRGSGASEVLHGGTEDPGFQRWIDQHVFDMAPRTRKLSPEDALHCTPVVGEGRNIEWAAIFEAGKVGMGSEQREVVAATVE
jgi:hypothetical protein